MEYQVGQMWDVQSHPATEVIPPHVENIIVREKRLLPRTVNPVNAINRYMPPGKGGREVLFDGLTQNTKAGALYIAEPSGTPPYSTAFWIPDRPLRREDDGKRIRYRYPTDDGGFTLTFVGFQEPAECIEQGSILRVSLAHWWRPEDMQDGEYRCYVQLSGWFEPEIDGKPEMTSTQHSVVRPVTLDSPPLPNLGSARDLLKDIFGYDDFWPHQAEIIKNLLQKRDTLAIMPTGGGKSLCYQLPALMFDGLTVVVSPLISLMQDQVSQLHEWNIPSCFLNSTLGYAEYVRTTQRIRQGDIKLLYLAPETLMRPETMVLLDQCRIDCLTIDEAHCISSWGHDFRPEYRQMVTIRQRFLHAACFALTATATPRVQKDIKEQLAIADADEFVASFDRKNLFLEVQPKEDVRSQLLDFRMIDAINEA